MKLTARQERLVREFLAETDTLSDSLPAAEQRRVRNQMRARLREALSAFGEDGPDDTQVKAVLEKHRPAEVDRPQRSAADKAARPIPEIGRSKDGPPATPREELPETEEHRIWAGVCTAYSDRLGLDVMWLRSGFVVAGLVAAPLAFLAYAGLYLVLRMTQDRPIVPEGDTYTITIRPLLATVQLLSLFLVGWFVPRFVMFGADLFLPELVMRFGAWGWYVDNQWPAFVLTLTLTVPMAFVSGLPLKHQWDVTLHLLSRLAVALYACLISFGIASALAGSILRIVEHLMQ